MNSRLCLATSALIACLSGCGEREKVYVPVDTLCTSVPPVPHYTEAQRAQIDANWPDWERHVDWVLIVDSARKKCSKPAGGPR